MVAVLVVGALAGLGAVAWLGLRVRPRPLSPPGPSRDLGTVDLPTDLPDPVRRHYVASLGGPLVPLVETMALWGRARMKRDPLPWMPVTFWSEHRVGWSGLQLLAVTWFRMPVFRGRDFYSSGRGRMEIGKQRIEGHEIDQGENLFLWAELALVPSVLVTRPGVRWEHIDHASARLRVPFGEREDELVFAFDPGTELIREGRGMRYREPGGAKIGWRLEYLGWKRFDHVTFPSRITVTWEDQVRPWFVLDVDGMAFNVPVADWLSGHPIVRSER
jgi:hypothetical protein